jgi:dehydrogenase/reductase SDR family protein 1
MTGTLDGKVAVVTGASRGVGKGIALGLGEQGATVYVTGRTTAPGQHRISGTIGETADAVTKIGGQGVAVRCDHTVDAEVKALFQRVADERGRLDVLVNNAYGADDLPSEPAPFWELPLSLWEGAVGVGLRSHFVAAYFAAPLFVAQRGGLIVEVSSSGAGGYTFTVAYGVGKAAQDRLAADLAHELKPYGVASVSLWAPSTRTERVLARADQLPPEVLARAISPLFVGRGVAALAADPSVLEQTGRAISIFELAETYGFTEIDGGRPVASPQHRRIMRPPA